MHEQLNIENQERRSGFQIMKRLIFLVKPLLPVMCVAIFFGVIGYLCAIFLTILTGFGILHRMNFSKIFVLLLLLAVCRGVFHYIEQYCNHFIAFKLLAIIRHKVFAALRKLCPAKLEGRQKGNLISIITSDIELLEVFYAHTISPIAIAFLTSVFMVLFIGHFDSGAGLIATCGYLAVGVAIPLLKGRKGAEIGMKFRNAFGDMNSFVLDSLRGLDEPTSNLDSLNEGMILKALREACDRKTVVLVSHRKSTMNIVDRVVEMKNGRISYTTMQNMEKERRKQLGKLHVL